MQFINYKIIYIKKKYVYFTAKLNLMSSFFFRVNLFQDNECIKYLFAVLSFAILSTLF